MALAPVKSDKTSPVLLSVTLAEMVARGTLILAEAWGVVKNSCKSGIIVLLSSLKDNVLLAR